MNTITVDSVAVEISRRLDMRLDQEAKANTAKITFEESGRKMKEVLEEGLKELIGKGEYRGKALCDLQVKNTLVTFKLGDQQRDASIPAFTLTLGDESYVLSPSVNPLTRILSYHTSGRSLFFTVAPETNEIHLLVNPNSGRPFDASRAVEFISMILHGKG